MTNEARNEAIRLYQTANALNSKAHRNEGKMLFISLSNRDPSHNLAFSAQLDRMFAEAHAANVAFTNACAGMSSEAIVSIITEATA